MVLHQKDRARHAEGVDSRHQAPLLNLSHRSFIAGAGALVIGLTLRGGASCRACRSPPLWRAGRSR